MKKDAIWNNSSLLGLGPTIAYDELRTSRSNYWC
jgi:hypothetical protein